MESNDEEFLYTPGTYPYVKSAEYTTDSLYGKIGDKFKAYLIAGGKDCYFKATHIEFYGVDTNQINS